MRALRFLTRALAPAAALALAGCVVSDKPLLSQTKPLLGDHFNVAIYSDFENDRAQTMDERHYAWDGTRYVTTHARPKSDTRIALLPLGGDVLIQRSDRFETLASYWIARPVSPGVYRVSPVDEAALERLVRARICKQADGLCHVSTREDLLLAAEASAKAKPSTSVSLAILTADALE